MIIFYQVTLESDEADLRNDVQQIFHFLIHGVQEEGGVQIFKLLLTNLNASKSIVSWCPLLSTLYKKLLQVGHSSIYTDKSLISVAEKLISNIETESPTSVDKNLNLTVGVVQLVSGSPFLYQRIPNFSTVLSCTENLLKSKIPAEKRRTLLQVAPFLTEVYSCSSWIGNKMCYNLACIELKLALEEIVHKYEESGEETVSEVCMESIVACCGTIENCIGELVDSENNQMDGKLLQSLIDDIRMAMTSSMFYLQKSLTKQGVFIPVLRLFMRWLSDDSADVDQIIATFTALKNFYEIPKNYSEFGNFMVSAVIFQMEDKKFRDFAKNEFAYFLLEISLRGLLSSECLILAPVFNDLLTYDIFINLKKISEKDQMSECICRIFSLEDKTLSTFSLCQIQVCSYLILCLTKRNQSLQSVCDSYTVSIWTSKAINYLLAPLRGEEPPENWLDLKDIWFSSVHSVCELIEKSSEEIIFSGVDMDVLIRKSMNCSETGDEISGALEELLSLIVGSS